MPVLCVLWTKQGAANCPGPNLARHLCLLVAFDWNTAALIQVSVVVAALTPG